MVGHKLLCLLAIAEFEQRKDCIRVVKSLYALLQGSIQQHYNTVLPVCKTPLSTAHLSPLVQQMLLSMMC